MKIMLVLLSVTIMFVSFQRAQACQPPQSRYVLQSIEINALFNDENVSKTVNDLVGRNHVVKALSAEQKGYEITLTNNCKFTAVAKWESRGIGMCPMFSGFKVENVTCPEKK